MYSLLALVCGSWDNSNHCMFRPSLPKSIWGPFGKKKDNLPCCLRNISLILSGNKESTTSKTCKMAVNSLGQNTRRKQGSSLRNAESPQSMTWCGKHIDTVTSLSQEWARKDESCMGKFFCYIVCFHFSARIWTGVIYAKKIQDYYIPKGYLNKYKIKILSDQEVVGHSLLGNLLSY